MERRHKAEAGKEVDVSVASLSHDRRENRGIVLGRYRQVTLNAQRHVTVFSWQTGCLLDWLKER